MEKPVAAIEFGSKKIKLVVGYVLEGQVYVIYAFNKPYGNVLEEGVFKDRAKAIETVEGLANFVDDSIKLHLSISDAILTLPPKGLVNYQIEQTIAVGGNARIGSDQLHNIYAIINKQFRGKIDNKIVSIAPYLYVLDQGRSFDYAPFGQESEELTIKAMVHTIPNNVYVEYASVLNDGGIVNNRNLIAPYSAAQLLTTYPEVPQKYFLVDIGSDTTTVSLVGKGQVYASRFIPWGSDFITESIANTFNVNQIEAERCKITYGLDYSEISLKIPVCKVKNEEGKDSEYFKEDLNEIIESELNLFSKSLGNSIADIRDACMSATSPILPIVLIGGGAKLNGIKQFIQKKFEQSNVYVVFPKSLGARNPTYTNCLGAILAHNRLPDIKEDMGPRVGTLTREDTSKDKKER